MRNIYFTCGPSQLYPKVNQYINDASSDGIPSISHRGVTFQKLFAETVLNLKRLLAIPRTYHIFFLSSSLESMERIIENCVEKYSFHFVNGAFSRKFFHITQELKRSPEKKEAEEGAGFDLTRMQIPNKTELIAVTQNETSTGVSIPTQYINTISHLYPHALIAVDVVSSAPYVKLNFKKIDIAFFSVQKGFGLPAGMSVLIVNDRAIKKAQILHKKGRSIGSYHSFPSLLKKNEILETPETPNVLGIYLLGKVTNDMLSYRLSSRSLSSSSQAESRDLFGIEGIRYETEKKAKLIYDFFDRHPKYKPFVKEEEFRSQTTNVIDDKGKAKKIIEKLKTKGIIVCSGYGAFKETHIRIANFPAHSISSIKNLLSFF